MDNFPTWQHIHATKDIIEVFQFLALADAKFYLFPEVSFAQIQD